MTVWGVFVWWKACSSVLVFHTDRADNSVESEKPNCMVTRIPIEYEQSLFRLVHRARRDRNPWEKYGLTNSSEREARESGDYFLTVYLRLVDGPSEKGTTRGQGSFTYWPRFSGICDSKGGLNFDVICNNLSGTMLSWWTLNIPGIQFHTSETVIESAQFFLL